MSWGPLGCQLFGLDAGMLAEVLVVEHDLRVALVLGQPAALVAARGGPRARHALRREQRQRRARPLAARPRRHPALALQHNRTMHTSGSGLLPSLCGAY